MKKKILALLFSVLMGILSLSAQQLQTLLGETVAYSEKQNFSFAGYDEIYFYIVEFNQEKKKVTADLTAYSRSTMKQAFSAPIAVPSFEGDRFSLQEILFADDKILVFYSFYSKKDDLQQLMVTSYATDGTPSGKAIEVMRAPGKTKRKSGHFKVTSSENRKYFFVWHHPSAYGLGENTFGEYSVKIVNANLETLYEKESALEKAADLKSILVNNDGNAYIFADQLGGADEENFIQSINLKSKTEKHNDVGGKFKIKSFAPGSDFYVDEKGTVYFMGLYSPTYDEMKTKGIYVARFQENGSIEKDAVIPYTMTDDPKPRSKPKKDIVKEYYSIRDVKFREGNMSVLSCKNWLAVGNTDKTTVKFGEGMFQYTVDYNFKMLNETFVSRNQTGDKEEKEMAFDIPFFNAEANCLMFNDTKENMESENPEVKAIKKFSGKAIAQFVSFKTDGQFKKEPLFIEKLPSKRLLVPERYLKMNNNEVVILTKLAENYKFCKVFSEKK
jgi:hypothetical protein